MSIVSDGARVTISDQPCLGWLTPPPPDAPIPITVNSLPPVWAQVVITPHSQPAELIGSPQIAVLVPDGWRGSFAEFLDYLVETTGLAVIGTELMSGPLVHAFSRWLGLKYGGRRFAAAP